MLNAVLSFISCDHHISRYSLAVFEISEFHFHRLERLILIDLSAYESVVFLVKTNGEFFPVTLDVMVICAFFQSMNENESENLKKNISLLMGDLSHLKSSFLTSAFTGGLTRTAQHPVVSRSQSCKVPLEGSSAGHKVLARVGAGSAECSRGRFMATGGAARRHATFTSKDANRNGLDLDISSASSDVSHKVCFLVEILV